MATTKTTTSKPASKPRKAATKAVAAPVAETGRTVANSARPTRIGYAQQAETLASVHGWAYTPVADPDPRVVHIYGKGTQVSGGAVLTHPNGNAMHLSYFPTRNGESTRLDAAYLWVPGATQGRRVQTCYQVAETLANQGAQVAPADPARKRAQAETQQAETVPAPVAPVADKPARKPRARKAKAA